jgi:hypothetical protein
MGITTSSSLRVLTKGYINRKPLKAKKQKKKKKK